MKKKSFIVESSVQLTMQRLLLMFKWVFFFVFVLCIKVSASGYSQNTRVTLDVKKMEFKKVLCLLQKKGNLHLLYSSELLPVKDISLVAKDELILDILKKLLINTGLKYKVINAELVVIAPEGIEIKDNKVKGRITDETGKPLAGVSVLLEGSKTGTYTNDNGEFEINVPEKAVLAFSYVGYVNQSVRAEGRNRIDLVLKHLESNLDEVMVIGYGTTRKKDLTGTVSHIGSKEIQDRPITGIDQAMAAQLPGVQVQAITGTPGAAMQIRVRGTASISASNDPLYIVDGIPVASLQDIDPTTIESIDVLKDASSTAIYGARGSNGVVLLTTKKGIKGKTRIYASANMARQTPEKLISMMNPTQWIQFKKDLIDSAWVAKTVGNLASDGMDVRANRLSTAAAPVYNTHTGANTTYMYDPYWKYGTDSLDYVNWQKAFYTTAYTQRYNLSASGGNENALYMLSGEYLNQAGMVPNSGYVRYGLRSNVEIKIANSTKVGIDIAPSFSTQTGATVDGKNGINPTGMAPIQEKGQGDNSGTLGTAPYSWVADVVSPIYNMNNTMSNTQVTRLLSTAYIDTKLAKGLNIRATAGWNSLSSDYRYYQPTSVTTTRRTVAAGANSSASRNTTRTQYYLMQAVATYNLLLKEHQFNLIAGYSSEQTYTAATLQTNRGFANDNLYTFDVNTSTTISTASSSETKRRQLSAFSRLNYSYAGKYLVSASIRRDGISRFLDDKKWGLFPAISGAWRISQESFMRPLSKTINDLKIRYSWGITGNDRISTSDYPAVGLVTGTSYDFNGASYTGYAATTIANPNLRWEKTTTNNIGIDATILNNRVTLSFDYYSKQTKDVLLAATVLGATGYTTENKNIGSIQNNGFEINLATNNIVKKNFTWSTSTNFSFNKNKVLSLINNNASISTGFGNTVKIVVGQPLYSYYVYNAIGVYTTTEKLASTPKMTTSIIGDPIYQDVDKSGTITSNDITNVGHPDPNYIWGMTNRFTYKNFDFSFLLQGQFSCQILSMFGRNINRPTTGLGSYNAMNLWVNRFRSLSSPGDGVTPRIDASTASAYDSRWIYNGSFYKIKNLMFGYTLNQPKFIKGLNSLRVYLSVDNLWMHDHYNGGYSPEAFQWDYLADWSSYPTARTYSVGINIGL